MGNGSSSSSNNSAARTTEASAKTGPPPPPQKASDKKNAASKGGGGGGGKGGASSSSSSSSSSSPDDRSLTRQKSVEDDVSELQDEIVHDVVQEVAVNSAISNETATRLFELIGYYKFGDQKTDQLIVNSLLSPQLNVNARDVNGNSLLLLCTQFSFHDLALMLLNKREANANIQNNLGATALHFACAEENYSLELVETLLQAGASVDAADQQHGCMALHYAASVTNAAPLIKMLIRFGARALATDFDGYVPLDYALEAQQQENADLLTAAAESDTEKTNQLAFELRQSEAPQVNDDDDDDPFNSLLADLGDEGGGDDDDEWDDGGLLGDDDDATSPTQLYGAGASGSSLGKSGRKASVRENTSLWRKSALAAGAKNVIKRMKRKAVWGETTKRSMYARLEQKIQDSEQSGAKKVSELMKEISMLKSRLTIANGSAGEVSGMTGELGRINDELSTTRSALHDARAQVDDLTARNKSLENKVALLETESSQRGMSGDAATQALKKQIADMQAKHEAEMQEMQAKLKAANSSNNSNEDQVDALKQEVARLKVDKAQALAEAEAAREREKNELEIRAQEERERIEEDKRRAEEQAAQRLALLEADLEQIKATAADTRAERDAMRESQQAIIEKEIARVNAAKAEEMKRIQKEAEATLKAAEKEKKKLLNQYMKEQNLRKKFYNELEDLKGKIRVFCRVRPLNTKEKANGNELCVDLTKDEITVTNPDTKKKYNYLFDAVFGPDTTQATVFADTKRLMQSALDGYNVCIFAYGQTGSGKTWTMSGVPTDADLMGITPRAVSEIFRLVEHNAATKEFTVTVSMYELYRDGLIDLLQKDSNNPPPLNIKQDARQRVFVEGGESTTVTNAQELQEQLDYGMEHRHVAATNMNAVSSRSHLVQIMTITAKDKVKGHSTSGKLTLVDLAGSERADKTGASGDTMEEAKSINKSLSALGNVIAALTTGSKHVPYRDSCLTKLMQDSLGGNAKTLMFVNCGPADYNAAETKSSLDFAKRCKNVVNDAKAGVDSKELQQLRKQLAQMKSANGGGKAAGQLPGAGVKRPKKKKK